jgi:hypothetical protein
MSAKKVMIKIFISYRRHDSKPIARLIYGPLATKFGNDDVFMDTEGIPLGTDYYEYLNDAVGNAQLMLAVIGDRWIDAADEFGRRRLDDAHDFVRIEIESALQRNIPVVPLYVDEARVLQTTDLPETLKPIARRQAAFLDTGRTFEADMSRLINDLERLLSRLPAVFTTNTNDESQRLIRTLRGHTGRICSVAISADGRFALSGSADKSTKMWEVATGRELETISGLEYAVTAVAFSPNGQFVLCGSTGNSLALCEVPNANDLRRLVGHTGAVFSVAFSPDGHCAASGGDDRMIKLWVVDSGLEQCTMLGHADSVYAVAFSPDGHRVFSGGRDNLIKVWEVSTGRELYNLSGHFGSVTSIALSNDNRFALSGSWDKTLKLWDLSSGRELHTFIGHSSAIYSVAISSDNQYAHSIGWDNSLKTWDLKTGSVVRSLTLQMSSDPREAAIALVRDLKRKPLEAKLELYSEERVLDALVGSNASPDTLARYRRFLREGALDDRECQIRLKKPKMIFGRLQSLWRGTVFDAHSVLIDDSADEFLDQDEIEEEALKLLESNGIPGNTAAFSLDGRFVLFADNVKALRLIDLSLGSYSELIK